MESFERLDADESQSLQFSDSQSQVVSTETHDEIVNKNIKDLKKLQKTHKNFDEIYATLYHITMESDFNAMNFAVKEEFLNVKSEYGQSIFGHSIRAGNFQLAQLIIEFDGNSSYNSFIVDDSDFNRFILKTHQFDVNEALIYASLNGHHEIVKQFLTVPGIDVNAKNKYNETALIRASLHGYHEVVKLLLAVPGIDVNAKDKYNNTALIEASSNGRHEVVKLLLAVPGIDVNAKDEINQTALIWASRNGYHEVVKLLLTVPGIDVNAKDKYNNTALILASENGNNEVVKLLLTVPGIDVNAKDSNNKTALIYASRYCHYEVGKLLAEYYCNMK